MYIDARAFAIASAKIRDIAIGVYLDTTVEADVACSLGKSFPIDPFVGLQEYLGIRSESVDIASKDNVVLACYFHIVVIAQRGDGTCEQESESSVSHKIVFRRNNGNGIEVVCMIQCLASHVELHASTGRYRTSGPDFTGGVDDDIRIASRCIGYR